MVEIKETIDYEKFTFLDENRGIKKESLEKLKKSIEKSNNLHLYPILVTDKFEVYDGQHRLKAAEELGIPIYYIVDENYKPEKMILFNNSRVGWTLSNYLNFYVKNGYPEYIKFKKLCEKYEINETLMLKWVQNSLSNRAMESYKRGTLKCNPSTEILDALFIVKELNDYLNDIEFKPKAIVTKHGYHCALKKLLLSHLADPKRFLDRLKKHHEKLKLHGSYVDYLQNFIEIYNYDMRNDRLSVARDSYGKIVFFNS